jgi:hypothetical protein
VHRSEIREVSLAALGKPLYGHALSLVERFSIVSTRPTEWQLDSQDEQAAHGLSSFLPHPLQAFGHPALLKEPTVELAQLLVEQVVRLVYQADRAVGRCLRAAIFDIGPIGPIRPIRQVAERPDSLGAWVVLAPGRQVMLAQEILEVLWKLLHAGPRDAHQLEFGLARRARRHAALGDTLLARARGLDHLVVRARALVDEPVTEGNGRIVHDSGVLERLQVPVPAVFRNQALRRPRPPLPESRHPSGRTTHTPARRRPPSAHGSDCF